MRFRSKRQRVPSLNLFEHDPNTREIAEDECIFMEGDEGDEMFVVLDGVIELLLHDKVLATVHAGEVFGEMALVEHGNHRRSATAIARGTVRVVPIDRKRFTYLVQNTPYFAIEVMATMAARLRMMDSSF